MPHTTRSNYKAKWLAAVNNGTGAQVENAREAAQNVNQIVQAEVTATIGLKKVSNVLMSAADEARTLISLMDEGSNIGDLEFATVGHNIDLKLSDNDFLIMARRLRDVLRLATARIGILTEAYDDSHSALNQYKRVYQSVSSQSTILQDAVTNTLLIGNGATEAEFDKFVHDTRTDGTFHRFGHAYEDLDSDWEEEIFKKGTNKRLPSQSVPSPPTSDSEKRIVPVSSKERRVARANANQSKTLDTEIGFD